MQILVKKTSLSKSLVLSFCLGLLLYSAGAWSAACCGGAAQVPSLITAEDRRQWTNSVIYQKPLNQVDENGYWYPIKNSLTQEFIRSNYAQMISERAQIGIEIPIEQNSNLNGRSPTLLGDVLLTAGYRLRDETFSETWVPQILGFMSLALPTGRAVYESQDPLRLDVSGKGFYQPGAGILVIRGFGDVDAQFSLEVHHGLQRSFSSGLGSITYNPGLGGSASIGAGYNWSRWRWGGNLSQIYEDPLKISGQESSSMERASTASLTASYLFPELLTLSLSFSNQQWFGDPLSTSLAQTWTVAIQKRWPRE